MQILSIVSSQDWGVWADKKLIEVVSLGSEPRQDDPDNAFD